MRYAILFRGEAYRWGCDANGVALQHAAASSHVSMIAEPLERDGHSVRAFFTYDHRVCKRNYVKHMRSNRAEHSKRPGAEGASQSGDNTTLLLDARHFYSEGSPDAVQALADLFTPKRVASVAKIGNVKDQPDSIIGSLDAFLRRKRTRLKAGSSHASVEWYMPATLAQEDASGAFDFLILTRYDVKLLSPISLWPCYNRPQQVSVASRCEQGAWERFKCIAGERRKMKTPLLTAAVTVLELHHTSRLLPHIL